MIKANCVKATKHKIYRSHKDSSVEILKGVNLHLRCNYLYSNWNIKIFNEPPVMGMDIYVKLIDPSSYDTKS